MELQEQNQRSWIQCSGMWLKWQNVTLKCWHTESGKFHCSKDRRWAQGRCLSCGFGEHQSFRCTRVWRAPVQAIRSFQEIAHVLSQQHRSHPQAASFLQFPHAWGSEKPGFFNINKYMFSNQIEVLIFLVLFMTYQVNATQSEKILTERSGECPLTFIIVMLLWKIKLVHLPCTYPHGSWKYVVSVCRSRASWV